jgi:hypothetical protein
VVTGQDKNRINDQTKSQNFVTQQTMRQLFIWKTNNSEYKNVPFYLWTCSLTYLSSISLSPTFCHVHRPPNTTQDLSCNIKVCLVLFGLSGTSVCIKRILSSRLKIRSQYLSYWLYHLYLIFYHNCWISQHSSSRWYKYILYQTWSHIVDLEASNNLD